MHAAAIALAVHVLPLLGLLPANADTAQAHFADATAFVLATLTATVISAPETTSYRFRTDWSYAHQPRPRDPDKPWLLAHLARSAALYGREQYQPRLDWPQENLL